MNWHSLTSSPEVLGFVQFQYKGGGEGGEGKRGQLDEHFSLLVSVQN